MPKQTESHLYNSQVKTVYGFFMAKTFNRQLAEDLTSEVFTSAFEQFRRRGNNIEDKQKYLYGVMKLTWLQYLRSKYNSTEFSVAETDDFCAYAEDVIESTQLTSLVDRALPYILQLPDKQQQVLLLRFRGSHNLSEICEQLGKDMNYVKTTQKRGLASLKRLVEGDNDE